MPIVVACPACHQKSRVPDDMLGQSVKCPACGATFAVPPATPSAVTEAPAVSEPVSPRPLPADADALRAVRAGTAVQVIALGLYAGALGLFLLLLLVSLAGIGGRGSSVLPVVITIVASVLLAISGLAGIVGACLGVLAPPAHMARGLAIAVLVLSVLAFVRLTSTFGFMVGVYDDAPSRWGGAFGRYWVTGLTQVWILEVARLTLLALFWRAAFRIVRDSRGATAALRLVVGAPIVQGMLVAGWAMLATLAAAGQEIAILAVAGWLVLQLMIVLFALGIAARVRRRFAALVPDRA
jgi:hypothetical protein